jgi:hypothetical protein
MRRSSQSRIRAAAQTALLALASVALTLGAVEVGLRLAGYQPLYEVYSKPSILWRADPLLGWSHEPGAQDVFVGPRPWPVEFASHVRINSLGLRGPEIGPLAPGTRRVLLLGDSMVAGFEVEYEETFGALLQDEMSRALGAPVEVINAGVRGYGTDQSYLYYRERGRALEADAVVLFHSGNDPEDNVTLHRMRRPFGKPAFAFGADGALDWVNHPTPEYPICSHVRMGPTFEVERADGRLDRAMCRAQLALFDHSALFGVIATRLQTHPRLTSALYHLGSSDGEAAPPADPGADPRARLTAALVIELARTVRADGAAFLLVTEDYALPSLDHDALAAAGIEAHVVTPVHAEGPGYRFRNDSHLTPRGHERVAIALGSLVLPQVTPDGPLLATQPSQPTLTKRLASGPFGG